ncbi:hypothetical protein RB195_004595 [Necator americanus]
MVLAGDLEDGFDLDKIDAEIKIEKIRQTASKLSWDGFQQALRRNLMEKRFVFDTEGRIDLLQAISTIRRNLPVDKNAELSVKLKQLSDSLECSLTSQLGVTIMKNVDVSLEFSHDGDEVTSCKIGYFGKQPVVCDEAVELIRAGEFGKLRSKIFAVLATIPSNMTVAERSFCVNALDLFEGFLLSSSRGNFSFEAISTLLHGLLLPRTPLRPARIYYTVEPSYIVTTRRRQLELSDLDNLDYMELSVVSIDKEIQMPAGDVRNPWSSLSICKASLQLHFSTPMLFSYGMWRRLERHLARPAAVKENVNLYRYMSGFKFEEPELVMRTCLPEPHLQHWYTVNTTSLLDEKDCVISDICIGNGADLAEVVSIVRAQAIHNSLWESLLAMSTGKWKKGLAHVDIRIVPSPARFELSLCAESKMYLIRIELTREFEWIGTVEDSDGEKVNVELDSLLTTRINTTRSIPVALVRVFKELGCQGVGGDAENSSNTVEVDNETNIVSNMDKVGTAWLPMLNSRKQQKQRRPSSPEFTYEVHSVPMATRGGLLASYKEITCESGTRLAAIARAEARTQRVQSDTALAISDLEAICQLADFEDDDSKTSTPSLTARPSTSPAPRPPGCIGGSSVLGPGSGVPQLSPLETARLNMKHTVSAAAAVGLASASTDVFEFADDRSVGSSSAYPSPSPQYTPFAYGAVGSPLSGQSIRGAPTKRRPRARKSANMGDRVGEMSSPTVKDPTITGLGTRKPRGKTGVRRPRGSRRGALAMTHAELEMQQRMIPPLQRSYSDFEPMTSTGLVGTPSSPYVDTESDDECDPPPPPKTLTMFPSPAAGQLTAASSAVNSPSHSMSPLYTSASTPSTTAVHPPPSPLAAASPSVSQPAPLPSPRANQQRKSLDVVVGKLKTPSAPQSTPPAKRSVFSDLYDDGTESPPPAEERISAASAVPSTTFPNTTINASPIPPLTVTAPAGTSSPRVSEPLRDPSASNDSSQNTTPTVKIEGASKLILKIPKVPSRSSPSVETQKTKSVPMQAMPKLEKQEKKRDKEKKEGHKERNKEKTDEARRQKRKAEGKEKDREHKRHKTAVSSSQFDSSGGPAKTSGAPLPFGFVGSLKNFKIPKREEVKESPKEKDTTTAAPIQQVQPTPAPLSTPTPNPPPLPPKPSLPRKSSVPIPPPPMIPLPRQPLLSTPPTGPSSGPPMGVGPPRKPPPIPDHRDRRPSMIGAPPFRGITSSIPLPKGPPPPQATLSSGGGTWIRPPSHIPTQSIRSPSPDPNAMQIDDDLNSPEDSLRIADD